MIELLPFLEISPEIILRDAALGDQLTHLETRENVPKDALEDHLHGLVCGGKVDLATAQQDIARDWIAAYKKYFRTEKPLPEHLSFLKDRPWE